MEKTENSDVPRSEAVLSAPRTSRGSDLPRYEGKTAEIAHFRAVLEDASAANDREREREASASLARLYAQRGTDLDAAVALAQRALSITDDAGLRAELAGWLAGLGDPGSAALELRGSVRSTERSRGRTLIRTGVLLARANRADAAALLFAEASELDPTDAIPEELVGTLSAWAEEVMPRRQGALAFVEAARRREALGQSEAALEDLFRAFELCPTEPQAVNGVVKAIEAQGRKKAADEILRDAATALEHDNQKDRAIAVHGERAASALEANDLERALGAVLDLGEAGGFQRADYDGRIDEVLARTGLSELYAARMERRARSRTGSPRADDFEALARFYSGTLGSDDRAMLAFIEAASADPERRSATDALRGMAGHTGDYEPLVEALVRVVGHERAPASAAALALELAEIADTHTSDPALSEWALLRARTLDPARGEAVENARSRIETGLAERASEIARAEVLADGNTGDDSASRDVRIEAKRKLVRLYGKSPPFEESAIGALAVFVKAEPADVAAARSLRFFYGRAPDDETRSVLYESVLRTRAGARLSRREQTRIRADLASLVEADGSGRKAMDELAPLLDAEEPDAYGVSLVLDLALAGSSVRNEARALAALSIGFEPKIAAVLCAASGDAYRRAGALADARKISERALDLDPSCTRAASALARVAAVTGGRDAAVAIERALGVVVPRAWLCDALARSLESIGEHDLAFAWTQRWLGLAPGDRRAIAEFLRRCQLGTDPVRIAEALNWVLAQPDPPESRLSLFLDALVLLFGLDRALGGQVARRALDVFGPGASEMRERLGALADEHEDAGLAIALLERTIASDPEAPREVLIELAQRRMSVGDFDSAARELLRAQQAGVDEASIYEALIDLEKESGPTGLGSDGVVATFELKAKLFSAILADTGLRAAFPRVDATRVEAAWRALGSTRWDLAKDPRGSEQALFSAAECTGMGTFELYAQDLSELAGPLRAVSAMVERLGLIDDAPPEKRVQLALAAARLAAEHGLANWALDAALAALAIEPSNAEAIAMAESQAPHVEGGEAAIDHIYDALARAAMGMFGRRAAHYRAARQLERLGSRELALKHALAAFEAVPTEGTSWLLLTRLVDSQAGSADAVSLFQRVADKAKGDEKSGWYKRAVELSGTDRAGLLRRFDVVMLALAVIPEVPFVVTLRETVEKLAADGGLPDDALPRLTSATDALLKKSEGPDGARTSAQLARVLAAVGLEDEAFRALKKAIEIDGELEVFDRIRDGAASFAVFIESASQLVALVLERMADKHALVGPPLLRFASAVADELSDSRSSAALLEEAELRDGQEFASERHSIHDDPFADPSMLDSAPPPLPAPQEIAEPEPEVAPQAAADVTTEMPLTDLLASEAPPPRSVPAPRRSSSSSSSQMAAVRDGFDALFDETGDLGAPAPPDDFEVREAEARERGDHEAVSEMLLERIVASSWTEQVRVLKLRRAAVLEQRLQRPADAQKELEEVLAESPDDRSALSFLADMLAKRGEHQTAAPLYERLSELPEVEPPDSARFALLAARAHLAASDVDAALRVADSIPEAQVDQEVHRFRLELMRKKGDMFSLVLTIDQVLANSSLPDIEAAELLVEACRAASAAGDEQGALIRARRAARLAPELPDATLECARLEYRSRGMGTPRDAQAVVDTLNSVLPHLLTEHIELHTFLLAEALDVIQGGGAGLRELSHRHAEVGPLPLIALGMAERLSRGRSFEAAVPLFEIAMDGDLRGLRNRARVALGAADSAIHAGMLEAAHGFIEIAERSPETRPQIAKRRRELLAFDRDPKVARPVLEQLVMETGGITKARYLQQLARITADDDFEIAMALYEEALALARRDRPLADKIRSELIELIESKGISKAETIPAPELAADSTAEPPPFPSATTSNRPDSAARPALNPPEDEVLPSEPLALVPEADQEVAPLTASSPDRADILAAQTLPAPAGPPSLPPEQPSAPVEAVARMRVPPVGALAPAGRPLFADDREERLFAELCDGYLDAGDALVESYGAAASTRAQDVLIVRRHQAALQPGDRRLLDLLHRAAVDELDEVYARALEHVRAIELGEAPSPPPLYAQPREPDLLSALLFRDVGSRESEVLAIVWEAGMFRKELASYGLSGGDRVALTGASVLGEAYSEMAAHLASPRPLFHTKTDAPLELGVALLVQPAILATGEIGAKTPELVYHLAAAHAAASPDLVLAANLPEPILKRLFEALDAAFGPVRPRADDAPTSSTDAFKADVARIAAELWQRVNPRSERRLREICEGEPLEPERARQSARRAMRRAGLFASGDLALALKILAEDEGTPSLDGRGDGALEDACRDSEGAADLVRLATRLEYAEARWQLPAPGSVRRG